MWPLLQLSILTSAAALLTGLAHAEGTSKLACHRGKLCLWQLPEAEAIEQITLTVPDWNPISVTPQTLSFQPSAKAKNGEALVKTSKRIFVLELALIAEPVGTKNIKKTIAKVQPAKSAEPEGDANVSASK